MNIKFFLTTLLLLFITSSSAKKEDITLCIQPFDDVSSITIVILKKDMEKIFTNIEVKSPITFSDDLLNVSKTRYRADKIIYFLSGKTSSNCVTLGVTTKDISVTKGKYTDWGVMGLGFKPGKSCVISSFRLKGKNKQEKLYKVAIHELGHTQGLNHCPEKSCYMRDAEGKDHLNEEVHFCEKCKAHLITCGWKLK